MPNTTYLCEYPFHTSNPNVPCVGTRVTNFRALDELITGALETHDASKDRAPGQHYIVLPAVACQYVSCGVGRRTASPEDYHVVVHRGRAEALLKREKAAPATSVAVVVYTLDAYLSDPDVTAKDRAEMLDLRPTHVVVAILAAAGPPSELSPVRFVHNLAGGNNEARTWNLGEVVCLAQRVRDYDNEWCVVADVGRQSA